MVMGMKELIKGIRKKLDINQEELSEKLGVSPVTVNRWENDKAKPSIMAQNMLFEMCRKAGVDLAELIADKHGYSSSDKVLYHASRKGISGKIEPISRDKCDFGKGFYMGTDSIQPLTLVCNEESPVFYQMDFDLTGLKVLDIEVGLEWAMLIAYFRGYMDDAKGTKIYEKYARLANGYDVIAGYIANDRMYHVLTSFFELGITDAALIASLSALKLGKQYVAKTQKACDQIHIISEYRLTHLELLALQEKSEIRRQEGTSLANKMVLEHRRDGKFFDEILKGGR